MQNEWICQGLGAVGQQGAETLLPLARDKERGRRREERQSVEVDFKACLHDGEKEGRYVCMQESTWKRGGVQLFQQGADSTCRVNLKSTECK